MNYFDAERECDNVFVNSGSIFHICTPENFELIFTTENEYKLGMSAFGLCAKSHPDVHIFTFQLMSNHIHFVASGSSGEIDAIMSSFKKIMQKHYDEKDRIINWNGFIPKKIEVKSLNNVRNVIAYINRNGSVVLPEYMPTTYPWGANRFYFNCELKHLHLISGVKMTQTERQKISRSRKYDNMEGLNLIDGYISPPNFCQIEEGESFFSNARQYFNRISRNVENMKDIAQSIGESIYYSDEDLFQIAFKIASEKYNTPKLSMLSSKAKIELAQSLHFEYNAGIKQLQRILRMDAFVLKELFPSDHQ